MLKRELLNCDINFNLTRLISLLLVGKILRELHLYYLVVPCPYVGDRKIMYYLDPITSFFYVHFLMLNVTHAACLPKGPLLLPKDNCSQCVCRRVCSFRFLKPLYEVEGLS